MAPCSRALVLAEDLVRFSAPLDSVTPVPGEQLLSAGFFGHQAHMCCTYICEGKNTHTINGPKIHRHEHT